MATVRELRAIFTAEAKGVQKAFQLIRQEAGKLSTENRRVTDDVNKQYADMVNATDKLKRALEETNNVDAFSELTSASEKAQRELRETGEVSSEAMDEMERAVQDAARRFNSLGPEARESFDDVGRAIESVNGELQGLRSAAGDASADLNNLGDSSRLASLESDLRSAQQEIDDLRRASQQADDELENLGGDNNLDEATESSDSLGGSLGALGGAGGIIAGVGGAFVAAASGVLGFVAAGAGIFAFIKSSDELKKATNSLQVQTGATTEEMEGMRQELLNIYGNNFGESYEDIANSMAQVTGATQLTGEMLQDATESSLLLRDSFGWEVPEQMNAVRVMMTEFGYEAEEAMNLLAQGQQLGINGAEDLLDTFNEYSGAFNDLGFDGESAMNAIAAAVDAGARNTDVAADSMNEFATRIMDGSDLTRESLQAAGLDADSIIGKFKKGGPEAAEAFSQVTTAIGNIGDKSKQEQTAVGLFGTMAEDAGVKTVLALGDAEKQVDLTRDALSEMNEVKYDTIGEALTGLGRKAVANVLVPLQDKVMPGVNGAINGTIATIGTMTEAMGAFIRGDESAEDVLMSYGLDPKEFQGVIDAMNLIPHALSRIRGGFEKVGGVAKAFYELAKGNTGGAVSIMSNLGLSTDRMNGVINAFNTVKSAIEGVVLFVSQSIDRLKMLWNSGGSSIFDTIKKVLIDIWPSVKEALSAVVGFIGEQLSKIVQFWNENGATIMSAVSNLFNGIMAVVKFVMPLVLGIIKMVWGNIKGVISGALDVIMGLVKVFSGLFTGDFSKMWEGLKQVFIGAVTFLWNFVQLTFFGKILSGAKIFILSFRTFFINMWSALVALFKGNVTTAFNLVKGAWSSIFNSTKTIFTNISNFLKNTWASIKSLTSGFINGVKLIFTNGWTFIRNATTNSFRNIFNFLRDIWSSIRNNVSNSVTGILNKVRDTWSALKNNTSNAFRDIYNGIKSRFTNIVDLAKGLPQRIGDGIGAMASKVTSGVTKVINKLASTLGKGVNGVIGGINWVLGKIGVDEKNHINKWTVPQYAHGTKGNGKHPGGLMVVGDGTGSNSGPELIETPDGKQVLSPSKPTLTTAPKGTKVWSATETKSIMDMIPHYGWGDDIKSGLRTAGNWAKDTYNSGKEKVKAVGSKIKEVAVDAFDYIKSPGKFLDLALKTLGIEKPKSGNFVGDMAVGAWDKTKKAAIDFVKSKLSDFGATRSGIALTGGNGGGFGAPFRLTSRPGPRNTGIPGASRMHKGWDWAAPVGTPIPSVTDGIGYRTGFHRLSGNFVEVKDNAGKIHRYQHNSKNIMRVGQKVKKGQTIALVGATGVGSGPHLHYEPRGYEEGGIVDGSMGAQLAWLTEGGWAESVISHDPSKKTSQKAIWEQTGKELGFDTNNSETLAYLRRIAEAVESGHGHDIIMSERAVAKAVAPFVTANQNLKERLKEGKI